MRFYYKATIIAKEHKQHTKTFEELDCAEQAKSISAQISILEKFIIANIRKVEAEQRETLVLSRIEQVGRLVQRLKKIYKAKKRHITGLFTLRR
jgi:hypothetical protein